MTQVQVTQTARKALTEADGVDAPRRHRCAIVEVLNTTEGGVRVGGYH
ncbi:hypothetical protein FHW96_005251, partial [Novosphingobium sp. SG751A]|nr:hypothetical protein [Novosphingobium sp. SG751A]